ncbi:DUF982 domain-containing protein [Mesorhizobium sp. CO1-1-11]|uniref:DUF982 domain-containing protein n=1 Tax=Mesorhizobium sp. CO1-1-11 TaxID=2876636 RepID=UPI001CCD8E2E|nr:DUF982 domain-containing protein [Mesorhizobium sp. CO1-1-11]MBZ9725291.1 DUF982 domain-containing protein [Mesorhizobium sp. CO1-1-11]
MESRLQYCSGEQNSIRYRFARLGLFHSWITNVNLDCSAPNNAKRPAATATNVSLKSLQGLITVKEGLTLTAFLPVQIKFVNFQTTAVSSVAEARAAMNGQWKNKELHSYRQALRLLDEAKAGTCRQSIAFAAFVKAARDQDMVVSDQPSEGLKRLDALASSIYAEDRRSPRSV